MGYCNGEKNNDGIRCSKGVPRMGKESSSFPCPAPAHGITLLNEKLKSSWLSLKRSGKEFTDNFIKMVE